MLESFMANHTTGEGTMDDAVQLAIDMSEANWNNFKNDVKGLTADEINWALQHGSCDKTY